MTTPLNVLVLESEPLGASDARHELERAGHRALRCHEPGQPAFPCNAIAYGRRCPFDSTIVDVALVVRGDNRPEPAPSEDGAVCAIRNHVPLVVAGSTAPNPYADQAAAVVDDADEIVAAVERAAGQPLRPHTAAAASALRTTLASRDVTAHTLVAVRRRHGSLVVSVAGAQHLDEGTKAMLGVRMVAAVREVDHAARGIDVVFDSR